MTTIESTFSGASGSSFPIHDAGQTTPHFSQPDGTQPSASASGQVIPAPHTPPAGLAEWLESAEARSYEGRWVLFDDDLNVVDVQDSPSELFRRHPDRASPLIVFVQPRDLPLAV